MPTPTPALSLAHLKRHTGNNTRRTTQGTMISRLQGELVQEDTRSHHSKEDTRPFPDEETYQFLQTTTTEGGNRISLFCHHRQQQGLN